MTAPPLIEYGRMLDLLGIEGRLLMSATNDAPSDAQVGGVSGLTVERTLRHVSETFAEVAGRIAEPVDAVTGTGAAGATPPRRRERATGAVESAGCLAARLAALLAEFGTRHAHQPCPSWQPGANNVEFWLRRTLHATTVHRVDVQAATGSAPEPIAADLATDGIDEMVHLWFEHRLNAMGATASHSWSVRIDVDQHRWTARSDPPRMRARRDATESSAPDRSSGADAVVTGDPASTYLWLWGRLPDRVVRVRGDYDAVAQLWSLLRLATR